MPINQNFYRHKLNKKKKRTEYNNSLLEHRRKRTVTLYCYVQGATIGHQTVRLACFSYKMSAWQPSTFRGEKVCTRKRGLVGLHNCSGLVNFDNSLPEGRVIFVKFSSQPTLPVCHGSHGTLSPSIKCSWNVHSLPGQIKNKMRYYSAIITWTRALGWK